MKKLFSLNPYQSKMTLILAFFLFSSFVQTLFAQTEAEKYNLFFTDAGKDSIINNRYALINELENYIQVMPGSPFEAQLLDQLAGLYLKEKSPGKALFLYFKNYFLHKESNYSVKARSRIDSLLTFNIRWSKLNLADIFSTLGNQKSSQELKVNLINFLRFLNQFNFKGLNASAAAECGLFIHTFTDDPNNFPAITFMQGQFWERAAKPDFAILAYKRDVAFYPQSAYAPKCLVRIADIAMSVKRKFNLSRNYLIEVINQYPHAPEAGQAQYMLAQLYDRFLKDPSEALTQYRVHRSTFPESRLATLSAMRIAQITDSLGKYNEALEAYMDVVSLSTDTSKIVQSLQHVFNLQLNRFDSPIKAAKTLIILAGYEKDREQAASNLLEAAKIYLKQKDNRSAKETLTLILKAYPDFSRNSETENLLHSLK